MKKTITTIITAYLILFSLRLSSQESFSPNEFIVQLGESARNSQVLTEGLLREFNSKSLWTSPDNRVQIWEVQSFPYTLSDGSIITNINESVIHSQDKTEIDGASLDYQASLPNTFFPVSSCDQSDFNIYNEQGDNSVKISILDTGISDINDNSQSGFDFFISGYTGYDYVNEDVAPNDDNGHGSHLAGVIADIVNHASNNNITYDIRKTHDEHGSGFLTATIRAVYDAVDAGTNVINMSFSHDVIGPNYDGPLKRAIDYAEENNVLVVSSAGNSSHCNDYFHPASFPASYDNKNILSVASVGCGYNLSSFSNFGLNTVDIAMLGENVQGPDLGTGVVSKDGTSQATAIITGMSAVLGTHQPSFDPAQIKCVLIRNAQIQQSLESLVVAEGIADAGEALVGLLSNDCNETLGQADASYRSVSKVRLGLYPNPSHDLINFNTTELEGKDFDYTIIDNYGRIVLNGVSSKNAETLQLDIRHLPTGSYSIQLTSDDKIFIERFIKI